MGPETRGPRQVLGISNPIVRLLRDLRDRDGRREHGAFLIEGTRLVGEAVAASWPLVAALYDWDRAQTDAELADLVARIPAAVPASTRALKHASDTVTPQGIVAAARMPARPAAVDPTEPLALVLDGIADPGNAGTLLRSALGSGVRTVLAPRGSVDLFAPKVVRSGMGSHFHLRLGTDLGWPEIRKMLGEGREVVVAEARRGKAYYEFDWRQPVALVVGGEAHGPSPEALRLATARVSIPLEPDVESLNAAVAGSIILFEAKRQRDQG
ncbi:MAG: TrmH family RNA methyltransferase [Sphingomonadaceae bacterium]